MHPADRRGRRGRSPRAGRRSRSGGRVDVRAAARASPGGGAASRPSCAGRTCSTACRGRRWRSSCAGRGAPARCAGCSMASGVPVAVSASEVPVRDEVAVRPLLSLLDVVLRAALGDRRRRSTPRPPSTSCSPPIGGADAVALRRLRRALRREELDGGGGRTSDELLVRGAAAPRLATPRSGPRRHRPDGWPRAVAAGVEAARTVRDEGRDGALRWAPGVTAETVLWAMWQATGLAGRRGARSRSAAAWPARAPTATSTPWWRCSTPPPRFVDRLPQSGPRRRSSTTSAARTSPATRWSRGRPVGDAGRAADPPGAPRVASGAFVVVAGVQEGVWPDLRLRGSLLGSERPRRRRDRPRPVACRAAQAAVRYDETRLFLVAVSRATRAAARDGGAQRGRAAVGLPRHRRPAEAD